MSALTLFKQAGIADKLAFDWGQLGQTVAPYAQSGLIGAGIGGAGMGLASLMGGDDNESSGERTSRILSNVLKGVALGGASGAGYQAVKDKWFSQPQASDPIKKLQEQAASKGQSLDMHSHGYNHPWEQQAVNIGHGHVPGVSDLMPSVGMGTAGAATGMGINAHISNQARAAFAKNKEGKMPPMRDLAANNKYMSPAVKQRMYERMISSNHGQMGSDVTDMMGDSPLAAKPGDSLATQRNLANVGRSAAGEFPGSMGKNIDPNYQFSGRLMGKLNNSKLNPGNWMGKATQHVQQSSMNPLSTRTFEENAIGSRLANPIGQVAGPFAMRNAVRYGKYGLGGAAAGLGLQAATSMGTNALMHGRYSPEQMQLWSQGGM